MPAVSLGKVRINRIIALQRLAVEELAQAFADYPVGP